MNYIDHFIKFCEESGELGLFILAFIESIISPILPDVLLLPLCFSSPDKAIYYSAITTLGSVMGGFIGYLVGRKIGPYAVQRIVPEKHINSIHTLVNNYGGWAVFWGAVAPIPYKFISLTSGALGINMRIFVLATVLGRSKRFLLIGILIQLFGPQVVELFHKYSNDSLLIIIAIIAIAFVYYQLKRRQKKNIKHHETC